MRQALLDLRRALLVLRTAVKWGAGPLVRRFLGLREGDMAYPLRVRRALEELGLTYLKLGQFLALRFDILPPELCRELTHLFESVAPLTTDEAVGVVEAELGAPIDAHFLWFDRQPIASASVAQVHEGLTRDRERVAIKIQRPGIAAIFEADMRNLARLARLVDALELAGVICVRDVADEFATYTRRELDFEMEGRTAERLRAGATPFERVPRIFWPLTTSRLLTMEFVDGLSIVDVSQLLRNGGPEAVRAHLPGFDLDQTLHHFAFASLHQLYVLGFFHADPHPGNILVCPGNHVAFIDFGIFGSLTDAKRATLAGYIEAVSTGNIRRAYRFYSRLGVPTGQTDLSAFRSEVETILIDWYEASSRINTPLSARHVGAAVGRMLDAMYRHGFRVEMDTLLFWRAVIALDASALSLSQTFDLLREMQSFFARTQPSTVQRALAGWDLEYAATVRTLSERAVRQELEFLGDVVRGRVSAAVVDTERADTRHARDRWTRALAGTALSLGATLVGAAIPDGRLAAVCFGAALVMQVLGLKHAVR